VYSVILSYLHRSTSDLSSRLQYDQEVTTYSPDGRVFQVEYAEKASEKAGTAIGIRCVDGVVLGVEKTIISKLLKPGANKRIEATDLYSAVVVSGFVPDGRSLANEAREAAAEYLDRYGSHIPGRILSDRIASRVHTATIYWYERPFGCTLLLSTYDEEDGPSLYLIRPSGVCTRQFAAAIGRHRQGAKTELEKIKFDQITCVEAVKLIAMTMYKLHDDVKDKPFELELSWQCRETNYKVVPVPASIAEPAIAAAQEARRRELMEDSDDDDDE